MQASPSWQHVVPHIGPAHEPSAAHDSPSRELEASRGAPPGLLLEQAASASARITTRITAGA